MKKFGFEWPDHMRCELFPEYGSVGGEVCMDPMDAEQQRKAASSPQSQSTSGTGKIGGKKLVVNQNIRPIKPNRPQVSREDMIRMELFGQM